MPGAVKWRERRTGNAMASNARTVRIEWGDCDPAGIVFYPRYFAMFDHSTTLLIERLVGMSKHQLYATYGFAGYPTVETRELTHRLSRDGTLAVEGFETRVWTVHDPTRPGCLKAQPIPPELVAKFTAG
jgi:4-hydroxybenzoyl-CoA thioesterase